eukprot:15437764-Alexandrium_andersonii.AAC.1
MSPAVAKSRCRPDLISIRGKGVVWHAIVVLRACAHAVCSCFARARTQLLPPSPARSARRRFATWVVVAFVVSGLRPREHAP